MKRSIRNSVAFTLALVLPACGDDGGSATSGSNTETGSSGETADPTGNPSGNPSGDPSGTASPTTGGADSSTGAVDSTGTGTSGGVLEDLDMGPEDFVCLLDWDLVRRFRVTNLLGYLDQTLEVANSPDGGMYPVGTVIQLVPNEAMVKRAAGWSPATNDWEFFSLSTSADGTEILDRGTTEVINPFGGNCFACHSAAEPQWDMICEQDHGCDPIPVDAATIEMLQNTDPRCG
ncbi:MAG: hypothetical protein AAGF11_02215 [Myxococcota bacterium]